MDQIEKTAKLIRLSDTELTIANPAEDIRDHTVIDRDGEELGEVEDLLIDEPEKRVRLLEVASGGFLGLGKTKFLLPVEAITRISDDRVYVNQTRQYIAGAPHYDPDLIHREAGEKGYDGERGYYDNVYYYYGYPPTGPLALSIHPIPTMEKRTEYAGKCHRWAYAVPGRSRRCSAGTRPAGPALCSPRTQKHPCPWSACRRACTLPRPGRG